jgi:hypothetical protein
MQVLDANFPWNFGENIEDNSLKKCFVNTNFLERILRKKVT